MKNRCPKCGFGRAWKLLDGRLKCRSCSFKFSKAKNVWERYKMPHREKMKLLEYFVLGIPVYRARFRINCSLKTAERFFRDVRKTLYLEEKKTAPLDGELEMDESAFWGKRKGKRGWGAYGKILVFGIVKRNGKVKTNVVPDRKYETLKKEIQKHTKPGSLYYTDDYEAYASVRLRGNHVIIKKVKGKPKGRNHVNGIEGFWSYAKNWLYQYRGIHKKFFHLYLGEISYRFNNREKDLLPLIYKLLLEANYQKIKEI